MRTQKEFPGRSPILKLLQANFFGKSSYDLSDQFNIIHILMVVMMMVSAMMMGLLMMMGLVDSEMMMSTVP